MARLLSVALTEDAVIARTKTETRRLGWKFVQPGDRLALVRKAMGRTRRLPDGTKIVEPLVRLGEVEVISVAREPLNAITAGAVRREGFTGPDHTPEWFVRFFTDAMRCADDQLVTVIRWRYLEEGEE